MRTDGTSARKPVVVLTASAWATDRAAAEQVGCSAFITKPCEPEKLLRTIRRLLP